MATTLAAAAAVALLHPLLFSSHGAHGLSRSKGPGVTGTAAASPLAPVSSPSCVVEAWAIIRAATTAARSSQPAHN